MADGYEDDNPKTGVGRNKPAVHAIPPVAMLHLGMAMADGERKYGLTNWREKSVSSTVYYDAAMRHLFAWWDGENEAQDSGVHHLAHVMACCAIILDAEAQGTHIDNRPIAGKTAETIERLTKKEEETVAVRGAASTTTIVPSAPAWYDKVMATTAPDDGDKNE